MVEHTHLLKCVRIANICTGKYLQSFQQGAFAMEAPSHNERDPAPDAEPPDAAAVWQLQFHLPFWRALKRYPTFPKTTIEF